MTYPLPGVIVDPSGQSTSITITSKTSGQTPTVYSDNAGQNVVSMPYTISAPYTFYLPNPGTWTVGGVDVTLSDDEVATVNLNTTSNGANAGVSEGTFASRPAATGSKALYFATDGAVQAMYLDSASGTWSDVGPERPTLNPALLYGPPVALTDYGPEINEAIAAAKTSTRGEREVWLGAGDFTINTPINIGDATSTANSTYNGVALTGAGRPAGVQSGTGALGGPPYGTRLIAGPSLTGQLLKINGPISGWALANLYLDNTVNNVATLDGLDVLSGEWGSVEHLTVVGFTNYSILEGVNTALGYDTIHNRWRNIQVLMAAGGARGWRCTGQAGANTCYEDVDGFWLDMNNAGGYGLELGACDTLTFRNINVANYGSGHGVVLNYNDGNTNWPSGCLIDGIDYGTSNWARTVVNIGTPNSGGTYCGPNVIRKVGTANGQTTTDPNLQNLLLIPENGISLGVITPTVPASGTASRISWSVPTALTITAGASTCEVQTTNSQGVATTLGSLPSAAVGTFYIPAQNTVTLTYTSAPTWSAIHAG